MHQIDTTVHICRLRQLFIHIDVLRIFSSKEQAFVCHFPSATEKSLPLILSSVPHFSARVSVKNFKEQ